MTVSYRLLALFAVVALLPTAAAQTDFWTLTHAFGSAEARPAVLQLGVGLDGSLLAGLLQSPGGLQRSNDSGMTWTQTGLDEPHIEGFVVLADGSIVIGAYGGGVRRSGDGGATWTPSTLPSALVWDVVLSPDGGLLACTLDAGLYHSSDMGGSWRSVSPVWDVRAAVAVTGVTFLAALSDGREVVSTDGGATWSPTIIDGTVRGLTVTPGGTVIAAGSAGISRSTDEGATWEVVRSGPAAVFAAGSAHTIYAGGRDGVSRSVDGGTTWQDVNGGLHGASVDALAFGPDGFLYAGTAEGYLFRSLEGATASQRGPLLASPVLEPAVPNPFGTSTHIAFTLPETTDLDLAVYDLLGRRVATLATGVHPAGRHVEAWTPRDAANGTYLVRLSTDCGAARALRVSHLRR